MYPALTEKRGAIGNVPVAALPVRCKGLISACSRMGEAPLLLGYPIDGV